MQAESPQQLLKAPLTPADSVTGAPISVPGRRIGRVLQRVRGLLEKRQDPPQTRNSEVFDHQKPTIAVIGTGAVGLANAILAQEAGYKVTIYTDKDIKDTTTWRAAASYVPFKVPLTDEVLEMTQRGIKHYGKLADMGDEVTGIRRHTHWEVTTHREDRRDKPYLEFFENVKEYHGRRSRRKTPGHYPHGFSYTTFFLDIPRYIPHLIERFESNGGTFVRQHFDNMHEVAAVKEDVVIACPGIGARKLLKDMDVVPIRGQVVFTSARPEMLTRRGKYSRGQEGGWSVNHEDELYIYPQEGIDPQTGKIDIRGGRTIVGGTLNEDPTTDQGWEENVTPSDTVTGVIITANRRVFPDLSHDDVRRTEENPYGATVGLRPLRKGGPRVGTVIVDGKIIGLDYGHGGAGITLSWGSAEMLLPSVLQAWQEQQHLKQMELQ